ncbi:aspartate kinase [Candidatus Carsonella ruddii]|uniref:Aspartokinase n=1 Tax=Candidatus Carsonella ruddii (Diaphorina cf. continua) TaxID=2661587 RepID=A0A7R6W0G6_CARRU|nr:aspartate kinase [Candidatus Carsonella ruddii (Diaphorina cf. continua)]BCG49345.1 aspartate kinase [Candidatus Carsonella ruddii (Diaphorina cf. continua)]
MIIIQKFGGTSVGSKQRIKFLKNIIKKYKNLKIKTVIILSAISGETNKIVTLAKYFSYKKLKELDCLLCVGEQVSVSLFSIFLNSIKINSKPLTSIQIGLITNSDYSNARINSIKNFFLIKKILLKNKIPILAGFQGITKSGNFTTLGRGGSDTTAIAITAYLEGKECQIYTDVESIFFSDPRICKNYKLEFISFENMLELSSLGSKVLYVRSIEIARKYNVNIRVLSTFLKNRGTLISKKKIFSSSMERVFISGITHTNNEVRITVKNTLNTAGISSKIIGPIVLNNISVDMVIQNSIFTSKFTDFTFLVEKKFYKKAIFLIKKYIISKLGGIIEYEKEISKVSVVGIGLKTHNEIINKILFCMSKTKVNIILISTSETKISVLIKDIYIIKAIKELYYMFNKNIIFRRNGRVA